MILYYFMIIMSNILTHNIPDVLRPNEKYDIEIITLNVTYNDEKFKEDLTLRVKI